MNTFQKIYLSLQDKKMSLFNELPYGSIKATPKRNKIHLDDLKHQLFLNPKITGEELLEELDKGRCLKDENS